MSGQVLKPGSAGAEIWAIFHQLMYTDSQLVTNDRGLSIISLKVDYSLGYGHTCMKSNNDWSGVKFWPIFHQLMNTESQLVTNDRGLSIISPKADYSLGYGNN